MYRIDVAKQETNLGKQHQGYRLVFINFRYIHTPLQNMIFFHFYISLSRSCVSQMYSIMLHNSRDTLLIILFMFRHVIQLCQALIIYTL